MEGRFLKDLYHRLAEYPIVVPPLRERLEDLPVLARALRQSVPHCADLEHHHAHRVRHDVVQLARDAGALLGDRHPRRGLSLPLGEARAHLCRLSLPLGELFR